MSPKYREMMFHVKKNGEIMVYAIKKRKEKVKSINNHTATLENYLVKKMNDTYI